LSIKGQGTLHHKGGELVGENFMVGQIFEELVKEEAKLTPWMKEGIQNPLAQLETVVCYGFQTQQMCSHYQVEIIRVIMVWCARCKSKDSITSKARLSW
jgi:hypothetical protein